MSYKSDKRRFVKCVNCGMIWRFRFFVTRCPSCGSNAWKEHKESMYDKLKYVVKEEKSEVGRE